MRKKIYSTKVELSNNHPLFCKIIQLTIQHNVFMFFVNKLIFSTLITALIFASCENSMSKNNNSAQTKSGTIVSDSTAIADALHNFFTWYNANSIRIDTTYKFTIEGGAHTALDEKKLQMYFSEIKKSNVVSDELIDNETKFYHACAKFWETESSKDLNTGLGADRFLCAQDYIAPYNTAAVTSIIKDNRAQATLTLKGDMPGETNALKFEMKKENGKWLLSKLGCNSGVKY